MPNRIMSSVVRRAVVSSVNYDDGVLHTIWLDDDSEGPIVPIPHPAPNKGGSGMYIGIKIGTVILLSMASHKVYVPTAILPTMAYYNTDSASIPEADFDDLNFPALEPGDVVLQGQTGAEFRLNNGNHTDEIVLGNEYGEGFIIGGGNDSFRCSITVPSPVDYTIAPYGIKAAGIVRRDVKIEDVEESFIDFLTDLESEQSLEEIGWDPSKQVAILSGGVGESTEGKNYRNPAFVEERETLFEYGRDWQIGTFADEKSNLESSIPPVANFMHRGERRSNVLGLSLANPNELMERVSGTVVDIFGNMIDINRRILDTPTGDKTEDLLKSALEQARHTIAYHMEINVRKGYRFDHKDQITKKPALFTDPEDAISSVANGARDRSRRFIDVDKEGLTKVNIPASSETGNVPMITRYENSSVLNIDAAGNPSVDGRDAKDTRKLFRNVKNRDVFTEQVGPGGVKVSGDTPDNRMKGKKTSWKDSDGKNVSQKTMGTNVEAGTAFHDITETAWALIKENINTNANSIYLDGPTSIEKGLRAISKEINPVLPKDNTSPATRMTNKSGLLADQPNAGGRSVHLNLDGSMETSIGANTIDRVSWVLDTAGALVWRLGRDRSGRSAVIHADGTVALEVGGFDYIGKASTDEVDTRFVGKGTGPRSKVLQLDPTQFRSGKLVIRVRKADATGTKPDDSSKDTLLVIDETGITLTTSGRFDLMSDKNMSFTSKSLITIDAPKVQIYKDNPKYFARTSRLIK